MSKVQRGQQFPNQQRNNNANNNNQNNGNGNFSQKSRPPFKNFRGGGN
jgi:hypothetical protein